MRLVLVEPISLRGEGLGNEIIGWAKGFIASRALDAGLIGPAWGLNPRGYHRNFGASRFDVLRNMALRTVPHLRFTERDYWDSGCLDFGEAIERWAQSRRLTARRHYIVSVGGMYGGYRSIRRAAPFIRSTLLASRHALANLERTSRRLDRYKLTVAVHVRLGDFSDHEPGERRGQFNFRLPAEWYAAACRAVRSEFGQRAQFLFFSDQRGAALEQLQREFDAVPLPEAALAECSDVLAMAEADLRICSVSSYSLLACFLSDGPYLWYEPQLLLSGGEYRLWDDPATRTARGESRPTPEAAAERPGFAFRSDGELPRALVAQLRRRLAAREAGSNLIEYGRIAASSS